MHYPFILLHHSINSLSLSLKHTHSMESFIQRFLTLVVAVILITDLSPTCYGSNSSDLTSTLSSSIIGLQPVEPVEYRVFNGNTEGYRRRLAPFQLCLLCKCCTPGGDPNTCASMPCCFGIDCQLPNKPFGVCAFVPKTCNCTTCAA